MDLKSRIYEELSPFYLKTPNGLQTLTGINTIGQDMLRNLMQPAAGRFSAMIQGRPGSGKTRCTLGIVDAIVQMLSTGHRVSRPPIILLTYNIDIFMEELKMNSKHGLTNEFESLNKQLKKMEIGDYAEDHSIGLSYYSMYGFKSFENLIFNGTMAEKDEIFSTKYQSWNEDLEEMVEDGRISVNEDMIRRLDGCVIIADEIHETHARGFFNRGGLVISYLMQRLKNISLIISDATPMSRVPTEVTSIINLMLGSRYMIKDLFNMKNGAMVPSRKCFEAMVEVGNSTYVLEQPDVSTCPSIIIEGEKIKSRGGRPDDDRMNNGFGKCMNYIKCSLTQLQRDLIRDNCNNKINRRIAEIAILWDGKKIQDGKDVNPTILARIYPNIQTCIKFSPKIGGLNDLLFKHKLLYMPGMTCIFTSLVIAPGTELIKHYLKSAGLDEFDEPRQKGNLCLICEGPHNSDNHQRKPVIFGMLNKSMSPVKFLNTFRVYNSAANINGDEIKVLIVTTCVGVGVSLKETQRFIVYDQINSVPGEIQFRGRFDRPGSIKNPAGANIVHCFQLMTYDEKQDTNEILYAQTVHNNWQAVRPMLEFILNRAQMIEFADMSTPTTRYIDGPTIVPRKDFYTAKEIYSYHRYKIDNTAAKARLAKIKVRPHSDILITSAELRISVAGIVVKSFLMIMSTLTVGQILLMIKKHPPLMNYNISNLTSEDFYIFGNIINDIGKKMTMPILNDIATEANDPADFDKLLVLLMQSPTSPWTLNENNKLMKICFTGDMFYYIGSGDINIDPKYRPYIFYNEIFNPIDIEIKMQRYNREEHLWQINDKIDKMRPDEPILSVITRIPQIMIESLIMMVLLDINFKASGRLQEFIDILASMMIVLPRERAEKMLSKKLCGNYPLVYFDKSYHIIINDHLADIDIRADLFDRKETDIKLQLISEKNIIKIRLYNNALRDVVKGEGKRIQRGIEIHSNNTSAIINRLQTKKSELGDELAAMAKISDGQLDFKERIIDHISKLQLKNPDHCYLEFTW